MAVNQTRMLMVKKSSLDIEEGHRILEDFIEGFPALLESKEFQESFEKHIREENFSYGLPISYLADDEKTIIREYPDGHKEYIVKK